MDFYPEYTQTVWFNKKIKNQIKKPKRFERSSWKKIHGW